MALGKSNMSPGQPGQTLIERQKAVVDGLDQCGAQAVESSLCQGIQQVAPVGKMALRRRVADPDRPAEFTKRDRVDTRALDYGVSRIEQGLAQVAMMVGTAPSTGR